MPSSQVADEADQFGVLNEFRALQRMRKGVGLLEDVKRRALPIDMARVLGLKFTHTNGPNCLVVISDLKRALELMFALEELTAPERVVAFITWNIVPADADEAALLKDLVGVNVDWIRREKAFLRREADMPEDEGQVPKQWRSDRVFREQSDKVVLRLAVRLSGESAKKAEAATTSEAVPLPRMQVALRAPSNMPLDEVAKAALDRTAERAASFLAAEEPSTMTVDDLMRQATELSTAYSHASPYDVLRYSDTLWLEAVRRLDETRDPSTRDDLNVVVGKLFGLMSYSSLDLGDADLAHRHALASHRAAMWAKHDELMAWALGTQAMILRFKRDFARSLKPVDEALGLSVSGAARARLFAQSTLGHSELHKEAEVIADLRSAEAEMEKEFSGDPNLNDGIFQFPQSKYHYYAGSGLLGLGPKHASAAAQHSAIAIDLFMNGSAAERSYSDELLARVHQATSEMRRDELDAVPEVLGPLFTAPTDHRTSWHVQWLQRAIENLQRTPRYRNSKVVERLSELTAGFVAEIRKERDKQKQGFTPN